MSNMTEKQSNVFGALKLIEQLYLDGQIPGYEKNTYDIRQRNNSSPRRAAYRGTAGALPYFRLRGVIARGFARPRQCAASSRRRGVSRRGRCTPPRR